MKVSRLKLGDLPRDTDAKYGFEAQRLILNTEDVI